MREAIGMIEIRSFAGAIEATDAMLKAASVKIVDFQIVGSGIVSITVSGDVSAVMAAVESGKERGGQIGEIISSNVIPRPHEEIDKILDLGGGE